MCPWRDLFELPQIIVNGSFPLITWPPYQQRSVLFTNTAKEGRFRIQADDERSVLQHLRICAKICTTDKTRLKSALTGPNESAYMMSWSSTENLRCLTSSLVCQCCWQPMLWPSAVSVTTVMALGQQRMHSSLPPAVASVPGRGYTTRNS